MRADCGVILACAVCFVVVVVVLPISAQLVESGLSIADVVRAFSPSHAHLAGRVARVPGGYSGQYYGLPHRRLFVRAAHTKQTRRPGNQSTQAKAARLARVK